MPDENEQVALEDSANNKDDATPEAEGATETAPAPENTTLAEAVAETTAEETDTSESGDASTPDPDGQVPDSEVEDTPVAASPATHGMIGFGGAMLAASIVILLATIVIAISTRGKRGENTFIIEFRDSMNQMSRKLSEIEARTEPAPVIIGEVGNFDDFTRMMKVGNTQFTDGYFEKAAQSYEAAITLDASGKLADEAHYRLGLCLLKTGLPDEAIDEFRYVIENHPGSRHYAGSALELGELLMARRNYSQARRLLYMVLGSENQLAEEQQDVLEKTYYALARAYEGEAEAVEATRYNPKTDIDFGLQTGETP